MIKVFLRTILKEKNMTMTELHKKTDISLKALSALQNQKTDGIKYNTLDRISTALDIEIGEIIKKINNVYDVSIKLGKNNEAVIMLKNKNIEETYILKVKFIRELINQEGFNLLSIRVIEIEQEGWFRVKSNVLDEGLLDQTFLKIIAYLLTETIISVHYLNRISLHDSVFFTWKNANLLPVFYNAPVNLDTIETLNEQIKHPEQTYIINLVPRNPNTQIDQKDTIKVAVDFNELMAIPYLYGVEYGDLENEWKRKVTICLK